MRRDCNLQLQRATHALFFFSLRQMLAQLFANKVAQTKAAVVVALCQTEAKDLSPTIADLAAKSHQTELALRHDKLAQVHRELECNQRRCHCCESFEDFTNEHHGTPWKRHEPYADKCDDMCDKPDCNYCCGDLCAECCGECDGVNLEAESMSRYPLVNRPCCCYHITQYHSQW